MKNNKDSFYTLFSIFGLIIFSFFVLPIIIYGSFNTDDYEKTNNKIYNTTTNYVFYDFDYELESLPSLDFSMPEFSSSENTSSQYRNEESNITVYVTEYGSKYHRITCGSLYKSCIPIYLKEAINQGYGPCARCNPPFPEFE